MIRKPTLELLVAVCAALLVAAAARAQTQGADGPAEPPEAAAQPAEGAAAESGAGGQPEDSGEPDGEEASGGAAESTPAGEEAAGESAEDPADGPVVVGIEEGGVLDDQTFEGEDDDFIPSEEIPVDQPIPFPTDI